MARRRSVSDLPGRGWGGSGPPAYDDCHLLESGVEDVGSTETDWTGQGMADGQTSSFAAVASNGREAPIAAAPITLVEPSCSTLSGRSPVLLDDLVGAGEQDGWDGQPECPGGIQIDDQFEFHDLQGITSSPGCTAKAFAKAESSSGRPASAPPPRARRVLRARVSGAVFKSIANPAVDWAWSYCGVLASPRVRMARGLGLGVIDAAGG
jgi:hypothetical protein